MSPWKCEYLILLPHMKKSTVVDSATGGSKDSRLRTSSGMFLRKGQDEIICTIEKRIADYTFIPVEHGEGLQVLHDDYNTKNGGQRIATLLMYLSDVEDGGETVFLSSTVNNSSSPFYNELSECAKKGLSVKPKMGDSLLFWSMKPHAPTIIPPHIQMLEVNSEDTFEFSSQLLAGHASVWVCGHFSTCWGHRFSIED